MQKPPIFIHSLFRAGSTYLFMVFRRSEAGYWCYQEPLHELAFFFRDNPAGLQQDHGEEKALLLRHPHLTEVYFKELIEVWPVWKDVISERIIYDTYFPSVNEDFGISYWKILAEAAKGRPVFQECRTAGRIGAIKAQMGGYHIYLWRNPWDQWWSYKVAPYFDVANQLIIHAPHAPQPVQLFLKALNLPVYESNDISGAFAFYGKRPLTSEQSYLAFYLLWCLGIKEGMMHADLMLSIDRLSDLASYQSEIIMQLKDAGIEGIDFSDCDVLSGQYAEKERRFFDAMETQVHSWLIKGGWSQQEIESIQDLRRLYQPIFCNEPVTDSYHAELVEHASRARMLVCRFETSYAGAEARAVQAEQAAAEANGKASHAEARAVQAEQAARRAEESAVQAWKLYHEVMNSRSWKITKPLRYASRFAKQTIEYALHLRTNFSMSGARDVVKDLLLKVKHYVSTRPALEMRVMQVLNRFPGIKERIKQIIQHQFVQEMSPQRDSLPQLSPRARQIYADLKAAIESTQEEKN